jgi:hypothetical protein
MVCGTVVWPLTVTVAVAVAGWSGNGPLFGGRSTVMAVSLQPDGALSATDMPTAAAVTRAARYACTW